MKSRNVAGAVPEDRDGNDNSSIEVINRRALDSLTRRVKIVLGGGPK
jgi:hypothetical protein